MLEAVGLSSAAVGEQSYLQELLSETLQFFWLEPPTDQALQAEETENIEGWDVLCHQFLNGRSLRAGIEPSYQIYK